LLFSTEETGAVGHEIEPHRGVRRKVALNKNIIALKAKDFIYKLLNAYVHM
jgi:hypothetical protein